MIITLIGRTAVRTAHRQVAGLDIWESVLLVSGRMNDPYYTVPTAYLLDRHLDVWEAWHDHAMMVGLFRIGMELPPGHRRPDVTDIGEAFAGRLRAIGVLMPDSVALSVYRIFTGEMPPAPALAPEASPVKAAS